MLKSTCSHKTGLITGVNGVNYSWRRLSDGGGEAGRQAAIMNQMIAACIVAYIGVANMILEANYLWPHKGNCQSAVLYLSVLAQMFFLPQGKKPWEEERGRWFKIHTQSRLNVWHEEYCRNSSTYFFCTTLHREILHFLSHYICLTAAITSYFADSYFQNMWSSYKKYYTLLKLKNCL